MGYCNEEILRLRKVYCFIFFHDVEVKKYVSKTGGEKMSYSSDRPLKLISDFCLIKNSFPYQEDT